MFFKNFSQLSLGIAILISGGIAGLYYFFKFDNGKSIKNATENIKIKQTEANEKIKKLNTQLKKNKEMEKTMSLMGDEMNKFLTYIPNKMSSSMILNYLNKTATDSGVDLKDIVNHNSSKKEEFYEKLRVTITVEGFFTQVLVFLSKLTSLDKILTVEEFSLQDIKKQKKSSTALDEVRMRMDIYGYKYTSQIVEDNTDKKGLSK